MVEGLESIENTAVVRAFQALEEGVPEPWEERSDMTLVDLDRFLEEFAQDIIVAADGVVTRGGPMSMAPALSERSYEESRFEGEKPRILALFNDLSREARSMGHEVPSVGVVAEAKRIFVAMPFRKQLSYDVYSMPDGGVAIGINGTFGRAMVLICEPGGSALCVVTVDRLSRRARYDESGFLPDDFVRQGLRDMVTSRELVVNR